MHQYEPRYSIKPFLPEEMAAYKSIRLEALKMDPGMFGNSYEYEAAFKDEQWLKRLTNSQGVCFALRADEALIGLTSILIPDRTKPTEGYLTQSYIRKPYRGKGLSRMLYDARLTWAKNQGLSRLVISHRASNVASRAANQHYGFRYTHRESRTWPDGITEDLLLYVLDI